MQMGEARRDWAGVKGRARKITQVCADKIAENTAGGK